MSDGVAAIRQLLAAAGAVTTLVPAARIAAGPLPLGIVLPAIAISSISSVDLNIPNPGQYRRVQERVQVTIMAADYPKQKAIQRAARRACADTRPTVPGLLNVTVHTEAAGPDFMNDEASIRMGSQDFIVIYNEER